ncbi:DNA mismatch repair protein Mlh1 [Pelomyxa schiedti]|nr:DNA mismatch repair protein Mlh1 [Pelomyxa schiedti]
MTADATCGYRASYSDGKMLGSVPSPCAAVKGTLIIAEDLFFNIPTRLKTLKNISEEYQRIVEVVTRYALHNSGIAFSCKKFGENSAEVNTMRGSTILDNIRVLFGNATARELLPFKCNDENLGFSATGYVSQANYSLKKTTFVLFINNRLVESMRIKKAFETVYAQYLPKGSHPWLYLAISITPQNIDVNVHPTKSEVRFLHEDEVVDALHKTLTQTLLEHNSSRTFALQNVTNTPTSTALCSTPPPKKDSAKPIPQNKMNRSDSSMQTLDSFAFRSQPIQTSDSQATAHMDICHTQPAQGADEHVTTSSHASSPCSTASTSKHVSNDTPSQSSVRKNPRKDVGSTTPPSQTAGRKRPATDMISSRLPKRVYKVHVMKECLVELISSATYVGLVDSSYSLMQSRTNLYVVNMHTLSKELMYQQIWMRFGNFDKLVLNPPASILRLAQIALESPVTAYNPATQGSASKVAQSCFETLVKWGPMLNEYFSIEVTKDGLIKTLPQIIENYIPNMIFLPFLVLRLTTEVTWISEKECFDALAEILSDFYGLQRPVTTRSTSPSDTSSSSTSPDSTTSSGSNSSTSNTTPTSTSAAGGTKPSSAARDSYLADQQKQLEWNTQHVVFPAIKSLLYPRQIFATDGSIVQVAALETLYKVFERC